MSKETNTLFWQSAKYNNAQFYQYYNRLTELSMSMFDWQNVPETIDTRFLELCLFADGMCVFFEDEALGYLSLRCMIGGRLNVYQIPTIRNAYASNGYHRELDDSNSVIIFNNMLHTNSLLEIENYSRRLWELDRICEVNAKAQKTPVLIKCNQKQRLTMKNLYKNYDGNEPFIFADENLDENGFKVLKTDAPYVADKIYILKTQIWNDALSFLGVSNINIGKRERLIQDEVRRNMGGTIAARYSKLNARQQACEEINKLFGLDMWCEYREDYNAAITFDDPDAMGGTTGDEGGENRE